MKRIHHHTHRGILSFIDLFYPLFRRVMPHQTFRYAACGGFNTVLDITIFSLSYNLVYKNANVHVGPLHIEPYIASFLTSFFVTFPIGFYLSRYVVFQETSREKREQLGRYFVVVIGCLILNYVFLKMFVKYFHWFPTPAKIVTTVFVVIFSYISQKHFTFKKKEELENASYDVNQN